MKILVTGANGFIGKNLCTKLEEDTANEILPVTRATSVNELQKYLQVCDFVFHLAGVNRPLDEVEFFTGNRDFTQVLVDLLGTRVVPIVFASSIQAEQDNAYGVSKKQSEACLQAYQNETGASVYIYRLPNMYGKWSRPNYNTVVATFCYRIARDLPIEIHAPEALLELCYIDDLVDEFQAALCGQPTCRDDQYVVPVTHKITLQALADTLQSFRQAHIDLSIANMADQLVKNLYSTYLSFLPEDGFSCSLTTHADHRGSFTEVIRTPERGQISINISKPGIVKGNHWHHSKNEKFLVVSGQGVIRFRKVGTVEIFSYFVSGEKLEVVDIPTGYTHHIVNLGDTDMVTLMWANECFDPEHPDTFYLEV